MLPRIRNMKDNILNQDFFIPTHPRAESHSNYLSSKETGSKQAGFSPWKTASFTAERCTGFFRDTFLNNPRNRPVGAFLEVSIRGCCGAGWVGTRVQVPLSQKYLFAIDTIARSLILITHSLVTVSDRDLQSL
jgi:hypothetical protein